MTLRSPDELPYKVELWDDSGNRIERILSRSDNQLIAKAAFDKAVEVYPGKNITLRIGIRVIEEAKR